MNKPSLMPRRLATVNDAGAKLAAAHEETEQFYETFGDQIDDVKTLMGEFSKYDDQTAAALVQAVILLTPEEQP